MKKILFITAFPPNQMTGGQTFSLNSIHELAQKHAVDVFYFNFENHKADISSGGNIKCMAGMDIKKFDFLCHFWMHPTFTRRFNRRFLRSLQVICGNYDILYFDYSQVALYSLYISHQYKVLRMHDVLCQKYGRKNKLLFHWIKSTERRLMQSFQKVFVPSQKDSEIVKEQYGRDVLYTNEYIKSFDPNKTIKQENIFVFYGYWKRTENLEGLLWFINSVMPLLKKKYTFLAIGGGLSPDIEEHYLQPRDIGYLGYVYNPLDIISKSTAVLAPLFQGAGVKVKVIDSFTTGTPVIGTSLAFEGLPNIKRLCCNCETPRDFANCLESFIPLSTKEKKICAEDFTKRYNCHHLLEQI